ncbi:acyl-CoA N-acyltransferase [Hysterangium stoloniferum]|nr:acyl-CoA N-acyltransferase [Hysterangium stoloniferum]
MAPLNPPPRHSDLHAEERSVYIITNPKTGVQRQAQILQRTTTEAYVHFLNTDRRLDEWVPESQLRLAEPHEITEPVEVRGRKRKRIHHHQHTAGSPGPSLNGDASASEVESESEQDSDTGEHLRLTAKRNFDKVNFGHWQIKTRYFSPYPVSETEQEDGHPMSSDPFKAARAADRQRVVGVHRTTVRAHGRTADLVAGGMIRDRDTEPSGQSTLWVCDRCFKYMREGMQWEVHTRNCKWKSPPGKKVYERGAHIIWEVDGATEKASFQCTFAYCSISQFPPFPEQLYCQNLSLFGKLFIDIKTLFFDTENFMFYLLTDADSQRDHVLGFFSKEKVSYDNYNLACIVTLPPYQRKGYGTLLIEFSYELSRRTGTWGTPERPLSDLGLRSYLRFWISVLVRFFRSVPYCAALFDNPLSSWPPLSHRRVLTAGIADVAAVQGTSLEAAAAVTDTDPARKRRRIKGPDALAPGGLVTNLATGPMNSTEAPFFEAFRRTMTFSNPDGSATTHIVVSCTLDDISKATALRPDDVAFALKECGLLRRRKKHESQQGEDVICISREMVEKLMTERMIKKNMMELNHVLL